MMVKQLQLAKGAGSANQTCAHFALAALELRGRGLPQLAELQELWCRPNDEEGSFQGLRKASAAIAGRIGSWWHSRPKPAPAQNGTLSLLEVFPGKAMPGAGLVVQTLDFASKRREQLKGAAWSAVGGLRSALDFLCDDACGLRENPPSKLKIIS
ncbi:HACE1 [Symbiodinium natans]|uniref:HACE1 protein n=1 Tax=Symbiodinium natans TaxID=878477 RepID=A0A812RBN4_9DINO|nr:HACE1 [Symbiodinium natans]